MTNDSLIGKLETEAANGKEGSCYWGGIHKAIEIIRKHPSPDPRELLEAATDACRFLDYFVNGRTFFEGGGMPQASLKRLQAAIAAMGGVEANSGNSASHSSAIGPNGDNVASPAQSEISVVDDEEIVTKIFNAITKSPPGYFMLVSERMALTKEILNFIRDDLRKTKPVPVSLEKCAKAIHDERRRQGLVSYTFEEVVENIGLEETQCFRQAKVVLDAAGVKYVE